MCGKSWIIGTQGEYSLSLSTVLFLNQIPVCVVSNQFFISLQGEKYRIEKIIQMLSHTQTNAHTHADIQYIKTQRKRVLLNII